MKKIKLLCFFCLSFIIFFSTTLAETFSAGNYIPGAYIKKVKNGESHYLHSQFINRASDGKYVYCVEPFNKLNTVDEYDMYINSPKNLAVGEDVWNKIAATAYYGYMYKGHEEAKWYSITQVAIWQLIEPTADFYFTDTANGNRVDTFDDDLINLKNMVNNYVNSPNELINRVNLNYGEIKSIGIEGLKDYILTNQDEYVNLSNTTLNVKATFTGLNTYQFTKGNGTSKIYFANNAQALVDITSLPTLRKNIDINVTYGNIQIDFVNLKKNKSNCVSKDNNIYGLYNDKDNLIATFDLSTALNYETYYLGYGNYYIKQISNDCATVLDTNKYLVPLYDSSYVININTIERVKNVHVHRELCDDNKCEGEFNAIFTLNDYINKIEYHNGTNTNGDIDYTLGIGKYYLNQIYGDKRYAFVKDIYFDLNNYSDDDIYFNFIGYLNRGTIILNVYDEDKNLIDKAKVILYDEKNTMVKEYNIKDGHLTIDNLPYGNYFVKESYVPDKYILNDNEISIDLRGKVSIDLINKIKNNAVKDIVDNITVLPKEDIKVPVDEKQEKTKEVQVKDLVSKETVSNNNNESDNMLPLKAEIENPNTSIGSPWLYIGLGLCSLILLTVLLSDHLFNNNKNK